MPKGRPDLALRFEPATIGDRRGVPHSLITDLVVLTDSEEFQAALKQAVSSQQRVWRVPTTDQAAELLAAGRVGVLVVDTECVPRGAPELITHLNLEFPDLVVVVAGTHDEVSQFAHLVGEGLVYRFLQKPVSPGRVRAFIDAAVRRHSELIAEAPAAVVARKRKPRSGFKRYAWLLVFLVAAVVGYEFWHRSVPNTENAPVASVPAPAIQPATNAPASVAQAAAPVTPEPTRTTRTPATAPGARAASPRSDSARDVAPRESVPSAEPVLRQAASPPPVSVAVPSTVDEVPPAPNPSSQVPQLVRAAETALAAGNLVDPGEASAKQLLGKALKLDPQNGPARRAFTDLQAQVLTQVQTAIKNSDPPTANRWIAEALDLGITDSELAPLRRALSDAEQRQRTDRLSGFARLAAQRLADDKLLEPAGDNARQYLKQLQTEDPALAAPLWQQLAERLLTKARREASQGNYEAADRWLKEAEATGAIGTAVATARADLQQARAQASFLTNVVPSSQLKTRKYTPPVYPPKALSQNVAGWVDLEFTVDTAGLVKDISVKHAVPTGQFEKAAADAVAKWRFEPIVRGGTAVEQRTSVRVQFKLDR